MSSGRADLDNRIKISTRTAEEPFFHARARDPGAPAAARAWVAESFHLGVHPAVLEQALQQADRIEAWPEKKLVDADHLTPAQQGQLVYEFGRRARQFWVERPSHPEHLVLAHIQGFNEAAGRARNAASLIEQAQSNLAALEPDYAGAEALIDLARTGLRSLGVPGSIAPNPRLAASLEVARAFIAQERKSFIDAQTTSVEHTDEPDLATLDDDARHMLRTEFDPALKAVEEAIVALTGATK